MENYENHRTVTDKPFDPTPTFFSGVRAQDNIFEFTVYSTATDSVVDVSGDYVFLSRSGLLSFWRRDMKRHFETKITVSNDGAITPMATGLSCMPKYKMVAISTTAADIRFFNCSTYKFQHKFSIVWLPAVVVNMDCHDSDMLVCGDFRGYVFFLKMDSSLFSRLRSRADHLDPLNIPFDEIGRKRVAGMQWEFTAKSHFSNVLKVKYIPTNRTIISCSINTKRAMLIHYLEQKKSKSFATDGGISCFDFCEKFNVVVTGCIDKTVKLWNPSGNLSCRETLTGHLHSISNVLVDEKRLMIVSVDRIQTIRIWDMLRPRCLQLIKFQEGEFSGRQVFPFLYLDQQHDKLIITTSRIAVLKAYGPTAKQKAHYDSELLILIIYNNLFDCLITVGNKSSVAVWDPESFNLIHEYREIHFRKDKVGIRHVEDITAAGLDPSERRLVTAGSTGSISVFFDNDQDVLDDSQWKKVSEHSIVSVACYSNHILASASSDGQIVIWLRKNADAKLFLEDSTTLEVETIKEAKNFQAEPLVIKRRLCGINQILFLTTREMDKNVGNLVSCGTDGRIRIWNVICANKVNKWRLISKFKAVFRDCDGVLSMATDPRNIYLITGDTLGYVRVYDLEDYYSTYDSTPANSKKLQPAQYEQFPFLQLKESIHKNHSQHSKFQPDGGAELGYPAVLLNCFRAHIGPVLKVCYSDAKGFIVTATRKGQTRLWSVAGTYLGSLDTTENARDAHPISNTNRGRKNIPRDIRRAASPVTLHVLNGGRKPHWERAMNALKLYNLGHITEPSAHETPLFWVDQKENDNHFIKDVSQEFTLLQDLQKRLPYFSETTVGNLRLQKLELENRKSNLLILRSIKFISEKSYSSLLIIIRHIFLDQYDSSIGCSGCCSSSYAICNLQFFSP
ncbi:hypothetical protein JTE90_027460 [Oedothorax gibbosus]|uniref:WD repeat-containing protein on Y chromosome n=1 Tax=Oedothorax gibbosus TaxID=931172 RepID=A0AAV6VZD9_9ARAC|nr:hypothetical protein JTE90_027460 [Oedothorax gibbosus]